MPKLQVMNKCEIFFPYLQSSLVNVSIENEHTTRLCHLAHNMHGGIEDKIDIATSLLNTYNHHRSMCR